MATKARKVHNVAATRHCSGDVTSLVELYNLTGVVTDLRLKGRSVRDIADYINDKGLVPNGYKVSYPTIYRWCLKHNLGGDAEPSEENTMVNTYQVNCEALKMMKATMNTLMVRIDEINKDPFSVKASEINQIVNALDRVTLRVQVLTASIGEMQEKVFHYKTVQEVVETIMAVISVQVEPKVYDTIKSVLRENPVLCEALKMIKPIDK